MAEGRPKGSVERKGKAGLLDAGNDENPRALNPQKAISISFGRVMKKG